MNINHFLTNVLLLPTITDGIRQICATHISLVFYLEQIPLNHVKPGFCNVNTKTFSFMFQQLGSTKKDQDNSRNSD